MDDGRSAPVTDFKITCTCAYGVVVPAASRQRLAVPASLVVTPSQVHESISSVAGLGLAKRSQKRFAMAGIDTNVWPLGPQEQASG
jgi:hypothetical protein